MNAPLFRSYSNECLLKFVFDICVWKPTWFLKEYFVVKSDLWMFRRLAHLQTLCSHNQSFDKQKWLRKPQNGRLDAYNYARTELFSLNCLSPYEQNKTCFEREYSKECLMQGTVPKPVFSHCSMHLGAVWQWHKKRCLSFATRYNAFGIGIRELDDRSSYKECNK